MENNFKVPLNRKFHKLRVIIYTACYKNNISFNSHIKINSVAIRIRNIKCNAVCLDNDCFFRDKHFYILLIMKNNLIILNYFSRI